MRICRIRLYQDTRAAREMLWAMLAMGGLLLAAPASPAAPTAPEGYLRAYLASKQQVSSAAGIIEVRGTIQGRMVSAQTVTWILRGESDDAAGYQITSPIDYPAFIVGSRVRVIGRGSAADGSVLELIAMVDESAATAWERAHAPKPQPRSEPTQTIPSPPQDPTTPSQPAPAPAPPGETAEPPRHSSAPPASPVTAPPPPRWKEPAAASQSPASKARPTQPAPEMTSRGWSGYLDAYKHAIRYFNPRLSEAQQDAIARSILAYSAHFGIDARLVVAVIAVESGFKPTATSHKGAMGLGQLMPGTAAGLGVRNAYDPVENIYGAVKLLCGHLKQHADKPFWEQLKLALASYNAGAGAVRKYGGVPPYRETQRYVAKVARLYAHLCGQSPAK
jgi:soluble lytic murein transglycosylase-like protein